VVEGFDASDADFQAELVRCGVRRWRLAASVDWRGVLGE
jgi:hypothetical protein